jgi:hypothetical protein
MHRILAFARNINQTFPIRPECFFLSSVAPSQELPLLFSEVVGSLILLARIGTFKLRMCTFPPVTPPLPLRRRSRTSGFSYLPSCTFVPFVVALSSYF